MNRTLSRFFRSADAATAVEYAVMLALILMVIFGTVMLLGTNLAASWTSSNTSLQTVNFGS